MEQHKFKIIHSIEDEVDVYRIIDLTDTSLVGITEMLENDDDLDRITRAEYSREIKANIGLRAKIVGYGIFVSFDEENTKWVPVQERDYMLSVLRQMAKFFEQEIVKNAPQKFEFYRYPRKKSIPIEPIVIKKKEKQPTKWLRGWRLALLITLAVIFIGITVSLIVFPSFRNSVGYVLEALFGLPLGFGIIMFLAYADDMFARR